MTVDLVREDSRDSRLLNPWLNKSGCGVSRAASIRGYVLPKFKVGLRQTRHIYLPGETVSGTVLADYFFGKSVADATVKLTAATFQKARSPW